MTDHVSSNAARAPRARDRERDNAAPRPRRRSRKVMTDRDLAELEALLIGDLQTASSPSIAGVDIDNENDNDSGAPVSLPRTGAPGEAHTEAPRAMRRPQPPAGWDNDNPARRHPARDGLPPYPRWANDGAPMGVMQRRRHSRITRALRFAVTTFSVFALVGVSALLVLLAVGREQGPQRVAEKAAAADRIAPLEENVTVLPPRGEPGGPTAVTGPAAIKPDGSRITEQVPAQGGGTVRPVETQAASVDAARAAESAPTAGDARAESLAEPQGTETAAATPTPEPATQPERVESAAHQTSAPTETAAAPAQPTAAEPAATRDAPVTTHVNLRAKPENDSEVLTVVPAGKEVAVVDCGNWCEVRYDGRQGFIHKRFVKGE